MSGNVAYLSAAGIALAAALRLAPLRLRDCRWFSAQVVQRVWPGMASLLQILALAELSGPLPPFVGKVPLVLYAHRALVPGLFLLPAVLVCIASLGCGCFPMGAVAVGLGDAAFLLLRTAGPGGRVFRVFGAVFLPGPAGLELSLSLWVLPGRGKENSKVRPSTRLGGPTSPEGR